MAAEKQPEKKQESLKDYLTISMDAIRNLSDLPHGSTIASIKEFIECNRKVSLADDEVSMIRASLKQGVTQGLIIQTGMRFKNTTSAKTISHLKDEVPLPTTVIVDTVSNHESLTSGHHHGRVLSSRHQTQHDQAILPTDTDTKCHSKDEHTTTSTSDENKLRESVYFALFKPTTDELWLEHLTRFENILNNGMERILETSESNKMIRRDIRKQLIQLYESLQKERVYFTSTQATEFQSKWLNHTINEEAFICDAVHIVMSRVVDKHNLQQEAGASGYYFQPLEWPVPTVLAGYWEIRCDLKPL